MIRVVFYLALGAVALLALVQFLRAPGGGECLAEDRFGVCTHFEPADRPEAPAGPAVRCFPAPSRTNPTAVECE